MPRVIVADRLRSYGAAQRFPSASAASIREHVTGVTGQGVTT
ncbi:hypothetical protein ACFYZ3_17320 [Streptomyces sp. NPDC001599]